MIMQRNQNKSCSMHGLTQKLTCTYPLFSVLITLHAKCRVISSTQAELCGYSCSHADVLCVCLCGWLCVIVARYGWFLGACLHSAHPASVAMVIPLSPNLKVYLWTLLMCSHEIHLLYNSRFYQHRFVTQCHRGERWERCALNPETREH